MSTVRSPKGEFDIAWSEPEICQTRFRPSEKGFGQGPVNDRPNVELFILLKRRAVDL
jgi:hypothetical protein